MPMSCLPHIDTSNPALSAASAVASAVRRCNARPVAHPANADLQLEGDRPEFVYM